MTPTIFSHLLKSKRDLLRVRQLSRHAAALLGFGAAEQTSIAAATFDLACQAFTVSHRAEVHFEIINSHLNVDCTPLPTSRLHIANRIDNSFHLNIKLPADCPVAQCDFPWALQQIAHHAPLNVFEEIEKLNRELLHALLQKAPSPEILPERQEQRAA